MLACPRLTRAACLGVWLGLATAAAARAQPAGRVTPTIGVATSFEQLRVIVGPDANVTVTDAAGAQLSGRISELSPSTLAILANGIRHDFGEGDVASIRQRRGDPLGNGALWGFAVGAGLAALAVGTAASDCDCDVSAGAWLWVVGANSVFVAGLGVGIDALIRRDHVIYRPGPAASRRLAIRPELARGRAGVSLSMGF